MYQAARQHELLELCGVTGRRKLGIAVRLGLFGQGAADRAGGHAARPNDNESRTTWRRAPPTSSPSRGMREAGASDVHDVHSDVHSTPHPGKPSQRARRRRGRRGGRRHRAPHAEPPPPQPAPAAATPAVVDDRVEAALAELDGVPDPAFDESEVAEAMAYILATPTEAAPPTPAPDAPSAMDEEREPVVNTTATKRGRVTPPPPPPPPPLAARAQQRAGGGSTKKGGTRPPGRRRDGRY